MSDEPCCRIVCGDGTGAWPVPAADHVITDPPFSDRTHRGNHPKRRALGFAAWDEAQAVRAARTWAERCEGWIVILTDHLLAPAFADALEACGRLVFAPVAAVAMGGAPRLRGDGPASAVVWIVASRPRGRRWIGWGSLPGWYAYHPQRDMLGGKPLPLMHALVRDYSRPDDLIVDPCAGLGTTIRAAHAMGRRGLGIELEPERAQEASRRLAEDLRQGRLEL